MSHPATPMDRADSPADARVATPVDDIAASAAWTALRDAAAWPYRAAGRYAWHFARGKLGGDPVYRHLLASGAIRPGSEVLDIGCGQGLVASLLRAVDAGATAWPGGWAPAPVGTSVTGIERMPRDVERARVALGDGARVVRADMRTAALPMSDTVLLLDVLHYVSPYEQDALLHRVHRALRPQGRLLIRVADAGRRGPRALTAAVDHLVARARGLSVDGLHTRTAVAWQAHLTSLGFGVRIAPTIGRPPFANVLLVCDKAE